MQDAFGIVIFAVVGISVVIAIVTLFSRGRLYDDIGRGGINDDREIRPAAPSAGGDTVERDTEIRQMLAAHNARAAARGEAELDIEDELQRLTAPAVDAGLREEVRELVVARNRRREARGEAPLDVEREVRCPRSSRLASASGSRRSAMIEAMMPIANAAATSASCASSAPSRWAGRSPRATPRARRAWRRPPGRAGPQ